MPYAKLADDMLFDKIKTLEEIRVLNRLLWEAVEAYAKGEPIMDDSLFDCYWKRLETNVAAFKNYYGETTGVDNLVLLSVGYKSKKTEHFTTVKHSSQMGSLDNCFTLTEFESFLGKTSQIVKDKTYKVVNFITEYKYDGFGLSLIYEKGYLAKALTRGDGYEGENIIANIKHVSHVPFYIKSLKDIETFEIRGECILTTNAFNAINKDRVDKGLKLYVNARNAVAGIMRSLSNDSLVTKIDFAPYEIPDALEYKSLFKSEMISGPLYQSDILEWLYDHGIGCSSVTNKKIKWNINSIRDYPNYLSEPDHHLLYEQSMSIDLKDKSDFVKQLAIHIQQMSFDRERLPFEIDGIVVKVNNLEIAESLGRTSRTPSSAVAWKFPPKQALGQLLSVVWQVGRTGIVTPVAEITPTYVGGVTVTRVTLHNPAEIDRLGIMLNDMVTIERRGDVIPKITGFSKEWREKTHSTVYKNYNLLITLPKFCPCCESKLILTEDIPKNTKELRCVNSTCKDQLVHSIIHFASREAMDIDGLGESVAYDLVEKGLVKGFVDIYDLTMTSLLTLDGFADKSASNLLQAIKNSKVVDLDKFIYALGIPDVGRGTAKRLAEYFCDAMRLIEVDPLELEAIKDIGPITAQSIFDWTSSNHEVIWELIKECEIAINNPKPSKVKPSGRTYVITGSFVEDGEPVSRETIKSLLESKGHKVSDSVSAKTTALLVGSKPGSNKVNNAVKANVKMFTMDGSENTDFLSIEDMVTTFSDVSLVRLDDKEPVFINA